MEIEWDSIDVGVATSHDALSVTFKVEKEPLANRKYWLSLRDVLHLEFNLFRAYTYLIYAEIRDKITGLFEA